MNKILKTSSQWYKHHFKNNCAYRTLAWRFDEENTKEKITEQEYIDNYIHPNDRWKICKN